MKMGELPSGRASKTAGGRRVTRVTSFNGPILGTPRDGDDAQYTSDAGGRPLTTLVNRC
jgi:hypothetical protein